MMTMAALCTSTRCANDGGGGDNDGSHRDGDEVAQASVGAAVPPDGEGEVGEGEVGGEGEGGGEVGGEAAATAAVRAQGDVAVRLCSDECAAQAHVQPHLPPLAAAGHSRPHTLRLLPLPPPALQCVGDVRVRGRPSPTVLCRDDAAHGGGGKMALAGNSMCCYNYSSSSTSSSSSSSSSSGSSGGLTDGRSDASESSATSSGCVCVHEHNAADASCRRSFRRLTYALLQRDVMGGAVPLLHTSTHSSDDDGGGGGSGVVGHGSGGGSGSHGGGVGAPAVSRPLTEQQRLARLQQMHHELAIVQNGGREVVAAGLRSSVDLASALSRLRARNAEKQQQQQQQQQRRHAKGGSADRNDDDDDDDGNGKVAAAVHVAWTASTTAASATGTATAVEHDTRRNANSGAPVRKPMSSSSSSSLTATRRACLRVLKGKQFVVRASSDSDHDDASSSDGHDREEDNMGQRGGSLCPPRRHRYALYDEDSDSDDAMYSYAQQRKALVRLPTRNDDNDHKTVTADTAVAQGATTTMESDVAMEELEIVPATDTAGGASLAAGSAHHGERQTTSDGDEPMLSMQSFRRGRARHGASTATAAAPEFLTA